MADTSVEAQQLINKIIQKLDDTKTINEKLFKWDPWICKNCIESIKNVSNPNHLPDALSTFLTAVIEKVDAIVAEQKSIEKESAEKFVKYRIVSKEKVDIFKCIYDIVILNTDDNLVEQDEKILKKVLSIVDSIQWEFKNFNRNKKSLENQFADKIFKNTIFSNKMSSINKCITDLVTFAQKDPLEQSEDEFNKLKECAQKTILTPLTKVAEDKNKQLLLDILRNTAEANYRIFYGKLEKRLNQLEKVFDNASSSSDNVPIEYELRQK